MRRLLTASAAAATFLTLFAGAAAAAPSEVDRGTCLADGGVYDVAGGAATCTTVTTREVLGPVVQRSSSESQGSPSGGTVRALLGQSQRASSIETTTVELRLPGGAVHRLRDERVIADVVRPLSCIRHEQLYLHVPRQEAVPLSECAERLLFTAPREPVPLTTDALDAAAFRRGDFARVCAVVGGVTSGRGSSPTCSVVGRQEQVGPVQTHRQMDRVDDGRNPNVSRYRVLVGHVQRVDTVETTVVYTRRGPEVSATTTVEPLSTRIEPVACELIRHEVESKSQHTTTGFTDVAECRDRGLLG